MLSVIEYIPDSWIVPILILKGVLALVGVILLIWHMNSEWPHLASTGRRLRYLALLAFAVLIAGATSEQIAEGIELSYRHLGALSVTALLVVSMIVSIREAKRNR